MSLLTGYMSWEEFSKLKQGTVLKTRWIKDGGSITLQVKQGRQWKTVIGLSKAPPGGGMMNWEEFKERTQGM